jgi:hypothetical protein
LAVLRVFSEALRTTDVVRILGAEPDATWQKGGKSSDSGANFCVSDAESMDQLVADIREFVGNRRSELAEIAGLNTTLELDIGIAVGSSDQYTATLPFEASDLKLLADSGIRLVFSAYPTSDEADNEVVPSA